MATLNTPDPTEHGAGEKPKFVGEEGGDENTTPEMDLTAAVLIGVFALLGTYLATQLEVPDTLFTAPGLFPVLAGGSLLAMAIGLAVKSIRRGAGFRLREYGKQIAQFFGDDELIRSGRLIGIIAAYIFAVDWLGFDVRVPAGPVTLQFSSFELFSIIALALILKLFWRASWTKCLIVAAGWSLLLAAAFRFGFRILLPGSG